jgi:hypothetical protein
MIATNRKKKRITSLAFQKMMTRVATLDDYYYFGIIYKSCHVLKKSKTEIKLYCGALILLIKYIEFEFLQSYKYECTGNV